MSDVCNLASSQTDLTILRCNTQAACCRCPGALVQQVGVLVVSTVNVRQRYARGEGGRSTEFSIRKIHLWVLGHKFL